MKEPKPKENKDEVEEYGEVLQKEFEWSATGDCRYKQRGIYLVCTSCEVQHAQFIGMEKIMVGEDKEGRPILKLRSELNVAH